MEAWETKLRTKSDSRRSRAEKKRLNIAQDLRTMLDQSKNQDLELAKLSLTKALSMLPPKQKDYLMLYFYEGKMMVEIADMYGVDKSTVCRTIHRAEANLKKYIQFTSIRFLKGDQYGGY